MKKKGLLLLLGLAMTLCGCQKGYTMEEMQQSLLSMKGYEAEAAITRITDHGSHTYDTKQYFEMETGRYRLEMVGPAEVAGNYTLYDGQKVYQYNPRTGSDAAFEVSPDQARNELFLGQFVKNYLQSEHVSMASAPLEQTQAVILEAVITGEYAYTATEKLWLDTATGLPKKLVLYDQEGQERYVVEYTSFTYTDTFDEDIFLPEVRQE